MKKSSTSTIGRPTKKIANDCRTVAPSTSTIAFLKQFARAYCPASNASLPGFVLN